MDSKDMQDIIRHLEADPVVEVGASSAPVTLGLKPADPAAMTPWVHGSRLQGQRVLFAGCL